MKDAYVCQVHVTAAAVLQQRWLRNVHTLHFYPPRFEKNGAIVYLAAPYLEATIV